MTESTTMSQTTSATSQGETSPTLLTSEQGTFQTESTTLTSSNTQTIQTSPTTEILLTEAPPKQHELFNNFGIKFENKFNIICHINKKDYCIMICFY